MMMAIENRNGMNKVMEIFTNPEAVLPSLHVHMHKPVLASKLDVLSSMERKRRYFETWLSFSGHIMKVSGVQ